MTENAKTGFVPYKRFLLSLGGLYAAIECLFALFGYSFLAAVLPPYGAALTVACTAAAAVAVMPCVHYAVNRLRTLALGRYHGALILSSLLAPLATAVLFNIDPTAAMVHKVPVAAFALFALFVALQTFSYTVQSITDRVAGDWRQKMLGYGMKALGAALVLALCWIYLCLADGSVGRIAYVLAAVATLAGVSVYFSTFTLIPKLIHTERASIGFADTYRRFFVLPFPTAVCYAGRYLLGTAVLLITVYSAQLVAYAGTLPWYAYPAVISVGAAGGIIVFAVLRVVRPESMRIAAYAAAGLLAVSFGGLCATPYVRLTEYVCLSVVCGVALCAGLAFGLLAAAEKQYMTAAYALNNASRGTHKCLKGMLSCAAVGTACLVCGILDEICLASHSRLAGVVALSVLCVVCAIVGVFLSEKGLTYAARCGRTEERS